MACLWKIRAGAPDVIWLFPIGRGRQFCSPLAGGKCAPDPMQSSATLVGAYTGVAPVHTTLQLHCGSAAAPNCGCISPRSMLHDVLTGDISSHSTPYLRSLQLAQVPQLAIADAYARAHGGAHSDSLPVHALSAAASKDHISNDSVALRIRMHNTALRNNAASSPTAQGLWLVTAATKNTAAVRRGVAR